MEKDKPAPAAHIFPALLEHIGVPADAVPEVEVVDDSTEYDGSEKLAALTEWRGLTPLQRRIVIEKLKNPEASHAELARICKCGPGSIVRLIHSHNFDKIADELAKAAKKELVMQAAAVMRGLLGAESEAVRLKAAMSILADAGILKSEEKTSTQNKNISVSWKKPEVLP